MSIRGIPDRTPLLLTYTCFARAQGQDTFKNTATLIGGGSHSDFDSKTHKVQTNDAGVTLDGISFNLKKVDENNISKPLKNAKFQLYECKLEIGDLTNSETYNQAYWDALLAKMNRITAGNGTQEEIGEIKSQFKITEYVPVAAEKTTGETGYVDWASLNEHRLYAWKETSSPENYTGNDEYHYFVGYQHIDMSSTALPQPLLPEAEQVKRKNAAWALDDACQLANDIRVASIANLVTWTATNVESKYTSISATKKWENDSDNLFKTRPIGGIKLQLVKILANGTRENVGNSVVINADKNGNWPTYIWNKLPAYDEEGNEYKYTVVETKVPNYTTQYSDEGEGLTSGAITVTNRMIPKSTDIHVEKRFDPDDTEKPNEIKVKLYVIETDEDGVSSEPKYTYQQATLNAINEWKYTFEKLDTTRVDTDSGKVYTLTYTVLEDTSALEANGFHYTVTYSDNGKGILENKADDPLLITNKKIKYGDLEVTKELLGDVTGNENKVFYVTVKNSKDEYLQSDRTTFGSTPYEFSVTPSAPLSVTHLVVDVYTVEEKTGTGYVDIIDGYEWDKSGSTTTGEATLIEDDTVTVELKNKYVPKMEISVTKTWNDVSVTRDDEIPKDASATLGLYTLAGNNETPYPDEEHQLTVILNGTAGTDPASNGAYGYQEKAWKATWKNLPRYDVNGNEITYVVKEESTEPAGMTFKAQYDGNDAKTYAQNGQNIENQYTSFRVQKRWMSNGTTWNPAYTVSTIYYHLYKTKTGENPVIIGGLRTLTATKTINVKPANFGSDSSILAANFTAKSDGSYDVPYAEEISPLEILSDGWSYTVVECDENGHDYAQGSAANTAVHWLCPEFNGTTTAIKNDLTTITAFKVWDDHDLQGLDHPSVSFDLYRKTLESPAQEWTVEFNDAAAATSAGYTVIDTKSIDPNAGNLAGKDKPGVIWDTLPRYDIETGKMYSYAVLEHEPASVPGYEYDGLTKQNRDYVFTNKLKVTQIRVIKEWKKADDSTLDEASWKAITYKVYRQEWNDASHTTKTNPTAADITTTLGTDAGTLPLTITTTDPETNETSTTRQWWQEFSNLPTDHIAVTTENETTTVSHTYYTYYVVEDAGSLWPGQTVETPNDGTYGFKFINKLTEADVTKLWTDIDQGAITSQNGDSVTITLYQYVYYDGKIVEGVNSVPYKTITMTYEVEEETAKVVVREGETVLQTRVVKTDNDPWKYAWTELPAEVMIDNDGNESTPMVKAEYRYSFDETSMPTGYSRKVGEQAAVEPETKKSQTITNVENAGYELPSTGGPGTAIFYGAGLSLMLFAFLGFVLTARKKERDGI